MNLSLFEQLRPDYDVIPVVRVLSADAVTPVAAFAAVSAADDEAFLLESVERGENLGRYSFVGFSPRRTLTFDGSIRNPAQTLRAELVPLRVYGEEALPPFFGGAVGYFGYGVARWSESLPQRHTRSGPEAKLLFFDNVIAFDHVRQQMFVVANVFTSDPRSSRDLLASAESRIEQAVRAIRSSQPDLLEPQKPDSSLQFDGSCTRERFVAMVQRGKEEIAAGEIFQIVLSQSWTCDFPVSEALTLYRVLRSVNPSPYMFLLRTAECTLVGASPEMLVRSAHGVAETRPIAGTRPRGANTEQDAAFAEELLADPKENAEHLMLVDLGRNDVGRVAKSGSVKVSEFRKIERYSHVMHLVSNVVGELRDDKTPVDLFLSCFPAGTVSGAPKIRAMELIDEIEPSHRGVYAGSVMYAGFSGNLDSCIAIRTIVLANGRATVQAGGGIVFDSDPELEYQESVNKSAALRKALAIAVSTAKVSGGRVSAPAPGSSRESQSSPMHASGFASRPRAGGETRSPGDDALSQGRRQ